MLLLLLALELLHLPFDSLYLLSTIALIDAGSHHEILLPVSADLPPLLLWMMLLRKHFILLMLCVQISVVIHGFDHALHFVVFVFVQRQLLVAVLEGFCQFGQLAH